MNSEETISSLNIRNLGKPLHRINFCRGSLLFREINRAKGIYTNYNVWFKSSHR